VGEELQHMQPEQHQPSKPAPQPLGAGVYAGIAFASLAATCLVGYGMYYAGTQLASQPVIRSLYYVLLWILGITSALFLFGVLRSAASVSGQDFSWNRKAMTLLEEKPRLPPDGLTRSARPDSDHRRGGRGKNGKKGSSPYAPSYDVDLAPPPVTLPTIDPTRHMAAFKRAMERIDEDGME
jgi:hypothetical protein